MSIYSGYVSAGANDWDDTGTTNTTLGFTRINDAGGLPTTLIQAYALLNTSGITSAGTPTISSATFYWKHTTLDSSKLMVCEIWDGGNWVNIYSGFGAAAATFKSTGITDSRLSCINASGGTMTALRFTCTNPTANLSRTLRIQAYETSYTGAPYVVLDYSHASAKKRRALIIS